MQLEFDKNQAITLKNRSVVVVTIKHIIKICLLTVPEIFLEAWIYWLQKGYWWTREPVWLKLGFKVVCILKNMDKSKFSSKTNTFSRSEKQYIEI